MGVQRFFSGKSINFYNLYGYIFVLSFTNLTLYEHIMSSQLRVKYLKNGGEKCPRLRLRLRSQDAFTRLQKLCKRGSLTNVTPHPFTHMIYK